ncbi:MAG TPA: hypothetical protein VD994_01625, partial [Prosthecobacter sp.]|nr:hypothetical protein [Prosthecobacter sp.]
CRGESLLPLLTGQGKYERRFAFAEEVATQMVVDERYKLVRDAEQPFLFDLQDDPNEQRNLSGKLPEVEKRLGKAIDEWLAATPPRREPNAVPWKKDAGKK